MSRIIAIGTAVPTYGTDQRDILDYMVLAYANDTASRKLNLLFSHSGIDTRYSVVPDFMSPHLEKPFFAAKNGMPKVDQRMTIFKNESISLAKASINEAFRKLETKIGEFGITHLITVTCTGLSAPGLDTDLIQQMNLPEDLFHISVNFMGCNAAFHAIKLSDLIVKTDTEAKVLIVCVELCTLHFKPKNNSDNLLSNTLFGDGAAAVVVTSESWASQMARPGLKTNGFYSKVLSQGRKLMGWEINPVNFEMVLDGKVPDFIGEEIGTVIRNAAKKLEVNPETFNYWAIHPGGKKILDTIKRQQRMKESDLAFSYKVLQEYGNMSSPTILFVLNEILQNGLVSGETIFSVGFGPGISVETSLMTYVE